MQNAYSPMSTEKIAQFVKANFPKLSMKQQIELTQYVIEEGGLSYVSKQDMQAYVSKYMKKGNDMSNNLEAEKLAVIKSNAAPLRSMKFLQPSERQAVKDLIESKTTPEAVIKKFGDKKADRLLHIAADIMGGQYKPVWNKNDAIINEVKAKKLAVIKSNAAPEVKLKALEKLNAMLTNVSSVEERLIERLKVDPMKDPKLVGAKMVMVVLLKSIGAESMTKIIMDETKVENLKKYAKDIVAKYETHPRIVTKEFAPEAKRLLKKAGVY